MPFTQGFRTRRLREKHYDYHHAEVNATDEDHYEILADNFLGASIGPSDTIRECVRPLDQAIVRWNYVTQEFGILSSDGFILSYFVADRNWHRFPSNRAYFDYECGRR